MNKINIDIKKRILSFLSNPYNVLFLLFLSITFFIYWRNLFIDSIWLDETQYMWDGMMLKQNPLHVFSMENKATIWPVTVVAILTILFKSFTAARLMGLFFALLGIIFTYLLGKRLYNGFVGLIAASMLAYEWWYHFLALKGLIDVAITAMVITFAYFLYETINKPSIKNIIITCIVGILTILTKTSGIFVIPYAFIVILITILFFGNKPLKEQIKENKIPIIILGSIITLLLMVFFNAILSNWLIRLMNFNPTLFWDAFFIQTSGLMSTIQIVLLICGTILLLIYRRKENIILIGGHLFLLFGAIVSAQREELRYFLPMLPFIYIVTAITLNEVIYFLRLFGNMNKTKILIAQLIVLLLVYVLIVKPSYVIGSNLIEQRRYTYSGYNDAMAWIHENIPDKGELSISNFFGCCQYNVGLQTKNDIRRIKWDGIFETFDDFKLYIEKNNESTVYLMPDFWESGQKEWVNLRNLYADQAKFQRILDLGFKPIYQTIKPVPTNDGLKDVPVNIILRRN